MHKQKTALQTPASRKTHLKASSASWVDTFSKWNAITSEGLTGRFAICLLAAFFFGIVAHAFGLFGSFYNHDSLKYVVSFEDDAWQVSIGRFLVPVYRALVLRGFTLPWLSGLLAMLYIGIGCGLASSIVRIRSKVLCAGLTGIVVTSISYTLLVATYINQLDTEMLAVALSCLAAFLWRKGGWFTAAGAFALTACMGIYQAHVSVCLVLVALGVVADLVDGGRVSSAVVSALRGAAMAIAAGIAYFIAMRAFSGFWHISLDTGSYNSVAGVGDFSAFDVPSLMMGAWIGPIRFLLKPTVYNTMPSVVCNVVLALAAVIGLVRALLRRGNVGVGIFVIFSICVLPLLSNIAYVLSGGTATQLMVLGYIFAAYCLACMGIQWLNQGARILPSSTEGESVTSLDANVRPGHRHALNLQAATLALCATMMLVITFQNTQYSGIMYQKRDLEQRATFSLMTRVLYRMESTPGYVPGDTPVCFVREGGTFSFANEMKHFEDYSAWMGTTNSRSVTYFPDTFQSYFDYVLNEPIKLVSAQRQSEIEAIPEVSSAPAFPDEGGVIWVGDTLVVKFR